MNNKAIDKKILPPDVKIRPVAERPSRNVGPMQAQTASTRAMADCMDLMRERLHDKKDLKVQGDKLTLVADLPQSSDRCKVSTSGWWGALTTSSRLYDFCSEKFLDPEHHLSLLGWDISKLKLGVMKDKEPHHSLECLFFNAGGDKRAKRVCPTFISHMCHPIYDLSGNGMSLAPTTKVLSPLLRHMGYFKLAPADGGSVFQGPGGLGALRAPTGSFAACSLIVASFWIYLYFDSNGSSLPLRCPGKREKNCGPVASW